MGRLRGWRRTGRKDEEEDFWLRRKQEASYHRSALTLGSRPHWSPLSVNAQGHHGGWRDRSHWGCRANTDQRKPLVVLLFPVRMTELGPLAIHLDKNSQSRGVSDFLLHGVYLGV